MISTNLSTCLTVEEFFTQANWQGKKLQQSPLPTSTSVEKVAIENREPLSLKLSVAEFFALNNWRGVKQFITHSVAQGETTPPSTTNLSAKPHLTNTVSQFLQKVVWQGQKQVKIAAEPEIQPQQEKNHNSQPQSLNIQDLSDLF